MEKRWFYNCLMEHSDFRGGKSYHKDSDFPFIHFFIDSIHQSQGETREYSELTAYHLTVGEWKSGQTAYFPIASTTTNNPYRLEGITSMNNINWTYRHC